jgi:ubiquinone/menaquinone biosynthesis C-methylase UbiE
MSYQRFGDKWKQAGAGAPGEEFSIFVPKGDHPRTQRQVNLFNYYQFVHSIIKGRGYTSAIEIGCGRGTMSLYLNLYERLRVICNDADADAIALAKKNFELHQGTAEFILGDATALPIPDNSVDVAVSIGLLEHLDDYSPLLKEQFRILKPGGVMISLNIPKKISVQYLNKIYRAILHILKPSLILKADYYRNSGTPEQFAVKASQVGFQEVSTTNVNPFPLFTPLGGYAENILAVLYRAIIKIRRLYLAYPFKTTHALSQAHFLVGFKK